MRFESFFVSKQAGVKTWKEAVSKISLPYLSIHLHSCLTRCVDLVCNRKTIMFILIFIFVGVGSILTFTFFSFQESNITKSCSNNSPRFTQERGVPQRWLGVVFPFKKPLKGLQSGQKVWCKPPHQEGTWLAWKPHQQISSKCPLDVDLQLTRSCCWQQCQCHRVVCGNSPQPLKHCGCYKIFIIIFIMSEWSETTNTVEHFQGTLKDLEGTPNTRNIPQGRRMLLLV